MSGERLGSYVIDRELGSGGMGKVYAASGPDGVVALKVVHPHLLETPGFFKRFMREAQLGQAIRHENVVRTLDCDQDFAGGKAQCFLVMELVEGQTLAELLRELERVPEELCRHVAREICKGLAAVHAAGVVHRDLKPENVIVATRAARRHDDVAERSTRRASGDGGLREGNVRDELDYVVKIMDLGVAQVADEALRLSKSGAFVGSVEYAAPEQFKGGDVDGRTDLHALGVLLYELSSGVHPYRGGGFHEVLTRVCDAAPRRLGEVNPQLSAFFEEVVHTLLVKDPRGRFAAATQLLSVLSDGEDSSWWHERARSLQATTKRPLRRIRIPRETAVYGRDAELARLRELFDRAKAGDGQVVLIQGEAGIGKSRLVDEMIARLQSGGEDLDFLFGSYPPGGAGTADGAFATAFREHLGDEGVARHLRQTPLLVPAFEALLRGDVAPAGAERLTPASVATCFVQVAQALAAERPTVMLIDDLHFAPQEARRLFAALAAAVPGHRLLLIGTSRPTDDADWRGNLQRLGHVSLLPVERLFPKDLTALLQDSFRSRVLAEQLSFKIASKSDGNPFFAFEIIRGLREGQFIRQSKDGSWASTNVIADIEIPSSVADLVNARVASLSEDERALLDVASCCGFEFDPGLVGEVLGMARIPTLRAFGQIERAHRLVRAAGRAMVFDHHQVREALYGSLLEQLREEYHRAIAETLESRPPPSGSSDGAWSVSVCEHYLRGGCGAEALRHLDAAQRHLAESYMYAECAALIERALAIDGLLVGMERARWCNTLAGIGGPLDHLRATARQERFAREFVGIAEAAGDDVARMHGLEALGWSLHRGGHAAAAEPALREALAIARELGLRKSEMTVTGNLAVVVSDLGYGDEALELMAAARALCREFGDRRYEFASYNNTCTGCVNLWDLDGALAAGERALALAEELDSRRDQAIVLGNLAIIAKEQARFEDAYALHRRAFALQREVGERGGALVTTVNLALTYIKQQRYAEAKESCLAAIAESRELDDRRCLVTSVGTLANACTNLNELTEARDHLQQQLELARTFGFRVSEAIAQVNLGPLLADLGDLPRAREVLDAALALCREIGATHPEAYALDGLGRVAAEEGDLERAVQVLEQAVALRRGNRERRGLSDVLSMLAEIHLRRGDAEAARPLLEEAVGLAAGEDQAQTEAYARVLQGCLPGGDTAAAEALLPTIQGHGLSLTAAWHLYRATGAPDRLVAAKRAVDAILATVPPDHRDAVRTHRALVREVLGAWEREHAHGEGDTGGSTESPTRVDA